MKLLWYVPLVCALGGLAQNTPPPRVDATGTANVSVTPDQAQINVSAVTQAASAQDAVNQNATIAANVIAQVTQALGSSGTVKTVSYSVNPTYNNQGTITGYTVTNTIQATLGDLTMTGKIIDTATQAGATRIDSLQFTLKDDTDARSQALRAATSKAKANADAMAAAVGMRTGNFLVIAQSGAAVQPVLLAGNPTASTPIQPGALTVSATVTVEVQLTQ